MWTFLIWHLYGDIFVNCNSLGTFISASANTYTIKPPGGIGDSIFKTSLRVNWSDGLVMKFYFILKGTVETMETQILDQKGRFKFHVVPSNLSGVATIEIANNANHTRTLLLSRIVMLLSTNDPVSQCIKTKHWPYLLIIHTYCTTSTVSTNKLTSCKMSSLR